MDVKRMLTLVFGLALVSVVTKYLVWHVNSSTRLYRVGYDYSYSTGNYIQFFIMLMIPSVAAFFYIVQALKGSTIFMIGSWRYPKKYFWF